MINYIRQFGSMNQFYIYLRGEFKIFLFFEPFYFLKRLNYEYKDSNLGILGVIFKNQDDSLKIPESYLTQFQIYSENQQIIICKYIKQNLPEISYFIRMQQEITNLKQQLVCLKEGHERQSLDYICVDGECQKCSLLCYLCKSSDHSTHTTDSLRIILHQILSIEDDSDSYTKLSVELDKNFALIRQFLLQTQKQYRNISEILRVFDKYSELQKEKIMDVLSLKNKIDPSLYQSQGEYQKNLCQIIQKNYTYLQRQQKDPTPVNPIIIAIKMVNKQVHKIIQDLEKYKKQKKVNDLEVLSLFPLKGEEGFRKFKITFNQELKGTCHSIKSPYIAEMTTSGTQRVLICDPSLQSNKCIKKWKVRVLKLASWIGIGACHINKIKEANFNFNYSNTNHGSYFISSNGYSWSSYKPQFNSKLEPFSFKTDDLITLQYNPKDRMLRFKKEETDQTYALQMQQNGDPLHPAINLTGIGDSVQIVQ